MKLTGAGLVALVAPTAAQWTCGGSQWPTTELHYSPQCRQAVGTCVNTFSGNPGDGQCQDPGNNIIMQQQPASGNNSHVRQAFSDILAHCVGNGYTTATWFQDSQWYWMAAGSTCYNFTMETIPKDRTTPVQQRLAIYDKNAIAVGWNTYMQLQKPCVQYGLSPRNLNKKECSANSETYPTSRTYSNVVVLKDLKPATTYYYKIQSGNSTVQQFRSPIPAGDHQPFAFGSVIDLGAYGYDGYTLPKDQVSARMTTKIDPELNHTTIWAVYETINDYEFIIHPGDFSYADQWPSVFGFNSNPVNAYLEIQEQFWEQLATISARVPYMVAPGNHDADCNESNFQPGKTCPYGQYNFTDFNNRWERMLPTAFTSESKACNAKSLSKRAKTLANPPHWYSFDYGMAHITMISTETDYPNAPDAPGGSDGLDAGPFGFTGQQLEFLKADLASVDRNITPWVIVSGHRPFYATGGHQCQQCQAAFEEIVYTYGVDLVVNGHQHNAERFFPVYNNTADPNGMNDPKAPMYIVNGGAGNIEGLAGLGDSLPFSAFGNDKDFSFAKVKFLDRSHMQIDFIKSRTGEVLDSSVLFKAHKDQFVINK